MNHPCISPEVQAGSIYLTETYGADWYTKINLEVLDCNAHDTNLLVQVDPSYRMQDATWERLHGFMTFTPSWKYKRQAQWEKENQALTMMWKDYILYLRSFDHEK